MVRLSAILHLVPGLEISTWDNSLKVQISNLFWLVQLMICHPVLRKVTSPRLFTVYAMPPPF